MGTPDLAAEIFEAIVAAGHDVVAAVTKKDMPKGRGKQIQITPVKEVAIKYNIPCYQPERVKNNPEFEEVLKELNADIMVVAAYGQILPESILNMSKYGCVNVHASLLPKYRGSAPIQWSIIDGEKVTGVTTMMMDIGIDTGDILETIEVVIEDDETGGSLYDKLAKAGAKLIISTMDKLEKGTITRTKQNDEESSHAKMLTKQLGNIDFDKSAVEIERLIRGLNPWPSAYTYIDGKLLKVWKAFVKSECDDLTNYENGQVVMIEKDYFGVKTSNGVLCISELQPEGKKRMDTRSYLQGAKLELGTKFK